MAANQQSDVAVAKMLTAVSQVELARKMRDQENNRFAVMADLEKGLRDIQRQYDGASTAVSVALKHSSLRLRNHDAEFKRLRKLRSESRKGAFSDLSQIKQQFLGEVQHLATQQMSQFEHMSYNHRKMMDSISNNHPTHAWQTASPVRPASRTPFRRRHNLQISPIAGSRTSHTGTRPVLSKQQEKLRDKWKKKAGSHRTHSSNKKHHHKGSEENHDMPAHRAATNNSTNDLPSKFSGDSGSETDESIVEDPQSVLAKLEERVRQSRKTRKSGGKPPNIITDHPRILQRLSQEAATPSFDSFLFAGGPSHKAAAESDRRKSNTRPNSTTNPFDSDSEDFVVDESFQPMPLSPVKSRRLTADSGAGSSRRRAEAATSDDDEGLPQQRPAIGRTLSADQSRAFDDKLWEIAGLGDEVPPELRQAPHRTESLFNRNLAASVRGGSHEARHGATPEPEDPLLMEIEAQLRAIEDDAHHRQQRWGDKF